MNKRCQQRVENAGRSQADADGIYNQRAVEVLKDDPAAVSGDAHGFDELVEIVADQHYIRAFPGNIRSRSHGYTDGRLAERGRVIDAVSQHGDGAGPFAPAR